MAESESRWYNQLQPDDDTKAAIETTLKIVANSSAYLLSVIITVHVIIGICLFVRFLRVTLGSRIKPDGKKAILITGATSGIGLVISKYFFKLGFTVIGGYFNDQEPGYAELLELSIKSSPSSSSSSSPSPYSTGEHDSIEIQDPSSSGEQKRALDGAHLFLVRMDVRSRESIEKSSQEIESILGQYGIELFSLINNAGVARDAYFQWSSRESIRDVIETNLTGVMMVTRQFLAPIIKSGGRVVNVASGLYMFPAQSISVYGASKSAVAYFSDALDADLADYGASCRCVVPGNFITTSNILFPRLRTLQECIAQLTPEEKVLYRKSIELYTKTIDNLVRKRFSLADELDPVQVSAVYRVRLPDDVMSGRAAARGRKSGGSIRQRLTGWFFQKLDGGASAASLEASGLIQGYDYAVRLKSCPRRLFPGNKFYSHFSGPIIEFIPRVICDFIAKLLMISIKNQ